MPILFVLGLVMGLAWPVSWRETVLFASAAATFRIVLGALAIDPITVHFWPPVHAPSGMSEMGHWMVALRWLVLVWTFAAFGEEIGYRGYLVTRAADVGNRSRAAYWIAVGLVSVLFGYGHFYKGPSGMVDSGMTGLVLGSAYLVSG